jgi:D-alanyl-D-alanine carboxypeptidase/D-alanyl-D-alanine-endopeptidase (penicillin-binding protein 4)
VSRHRPASGDAETIEGEVLATRTSPPLVELLQVLVKVSQNLHAELILREVGRVRRGSARRESGLEVLAALLIEIGTRPDMAASQNADGLSSLLPRGGEDGTLANRLCCASDAWEVRAKTGSLTRAITLSGYADSKARGRLAFSILVNNFAASASDVRAWVDRIAMTLVE